jgi:hypothetical protein
MSRRLGLLLLVAVPLLGCGDSSRSSADGLNALEGARAKARAAPFLIVTSEEGRIRMERFPGLTVIWGKRGHIAAWARRHVEYTARRLRGQRCYDRHTEFLYADIEEVRRSVGAPEARSPEARVATVGGRKVIRWRNPRAEEGYVVEGELYLDRRGRSVADRVRSQARPGARPGRWPPLTRYRYPAKLAEPPPPSPRC